MNNKFFSSLLCLMILTLAPACACKKNNSIKQDETKTRIELDDKVFEVENTTDNSKFIVKF